MMELEGKTDMGDVGDDSAFISAPSDDSPWNESLTRCHNRGKKGQGQGCTWSFLKSAKLRLTRDLSIYLYMSLFKAREWWHARCGHGEEFDVGSLCVANVDNEHTGIPKIVTGSFRGMLRIYSVKQRDFKADDLLLEQDLGSAILQIAAGHFSSSSGGTHLAILHPHKLLVANIVTMAGGFVQLGRLYEHPLEHPAANFTFGPFGGISNLDYLCVQSFDGQLSMYECESLAFSRFLPNFLVPGPIAYCAESDSFVTCSSSFELESYRYKALAAATGERQTSDKPAQGGHVAAKKVQADWKVILGEMAVDIRIGRVTSGLQSYQADIVVLCEHNVFVVSSAGQITFQKRLEYHPACFCTYSVPGAKMPGGPENLLIATHTRNLLVYRGNVLVWSARSDTQPVGLVVADLGQGMKGMIVTLDGTGELVVNYLGTDPMTNPVGFVEGKELNYEAMAREHRSLAAIIREHAGGKRVEPQEKLLIKAQIPSRLERVGGGGGYSYDDDDRSSRGSKALSVKLYVLYEGGSSIDDVQMIVKAPEPVTVDQPSLTLPIVSSDPDYPSVVVLTFSPGTSCLPSSTTASVSATFTTSSGEHRTTTIDLELPMCLFCTVVAPVKNAEFKITVGTNHPPPQLTSVFDDLISQASSGVSQAIHSGSAGANVLSFQFYSGQDCTILVSKTGGRYRLQSDHLEAMWLPLHELHKRLLGYYGSEGGPNSASNLAVTYEDPLPMDDFFEVVEHHFGVRKRVSEMKGQLEDRAVQFRNVEKRLLMRFKDKNPSPLNQLDFLMDETYASIMDVGQTIDNTQQQLSSSAAKLSCVVRLILLLIRYRFGCTDTEYSILKSYLTPEVASCDSSTLSDGVGWEELVEIGMIQLLRSALSKSSKEAANPIPPLAPAKDTSRLRKHVGLVLERLARGQRMTLEAEDKD